MSTTITKNGYLYDETGYLRERGIEVIDLVECLAIGRRRHRKDELEITSERITSKLGGWYVIL